MTKIFECGSVFPGCKYVVHDDSDDEIMFKAMEHARSAHQFEQMSPQLKARIRAAIREEAGAGATPPRP